jgi:multisubunit Na+/H+ antiporter MnhB subunit
MKIKTSRWTLLSGILFSITTFYYYWKNPDDFVGIIIFSITAIIFYIATIGNWKSGN